MLNNLLTVILNALILKKQDSMNKHIKILFSFLALLISCNTPETKDNTAKWEAEIIQVEQDFNDLAQKIGLAENFEKKDLP